VGPSFTGRRCMTGLCSNYGNLSMPALRARSQHRFGPGDSM
jgi:hypothetical protein